MQLNCDGQTSSNTGARFLELSRAPDKKFRGPGFEFWLFCYYFSHPITIGAMTNPGTDRLTPVRGKEPGDGDLRG